MSEIFYIPTKDNDSIIITKEPDGVFLEITLEDNRSKFSTFLDFQKVAELKKIFSEIIEKKVKIEK